MSRPKNSHLYSSVAQSVERQTVNLDVTGSSPVRGARSLLFDSFSRLLQKNRKLSLISQVVGRVF